MIAEPQSDLLHSKAMPDLIVKLLAERQEVLVLLNELVQLKPYREAARVQPVLQQFCQVLVDYVALGHFEVYQCIDDNASDSEHCRRVKALAKELFPPISATTERAIAFNDRYDTSQYCRVLDTLCQDLSQLGEDLATRIELEDRLIGTIQTAASQPSQTAAG